VDTSAVESGGKQGEGRDRALTSTSRALRPQPMRAFGEQQDEAGRGIAREEFRQRPAGRGRTNERNSFAKRKDAAANESILSGLRPSV
jgi:hypothetical protein